MKLKEGIEMSALLDSAKDCTGDVFFHSTEGNIINLKSLLSQYLLASIACKPRLLDKAEVVCTKDEDYAKLSDFLE